MSPDIRIAAALITRPDGQLLLVRKRGTIAFMQPGGKLEAGETPAESLCRELAEELALRVEPGAPVHLGRHAAPAAHEPGRQVVAELFHLAIGHDEPVAPAAEIEEIAWIDPAAPGELPLAPLTRDRVLPLCAALMGDSSAVR